MALTRPRGFPRLLGLVPPAKLKSSQATKTNQQVFKTTSKSVRTTFQQVFKQFSILFSTSFQKVFNKVSKGFRKVSKQIFKNRCLPSISFIQLHRRHFQRLKIFQNLCEYQRYHSRYSPFCNFFRKNTGPISILLYKKKSFF